MTGEKGWFSSLVPVVTKRYITFGDNGRGHVLSEGEIKVSEKITLRRVIWTSLGPLIWWVPGPATRWPLGLPGLRYTAPDGVEHKGYIGEVLG
jgi:hypothetical protein